MSPAPTESKNSVATRRSLWLFLDVDGVLNSSDYMRNRRAVRRPTPHAIDAPTIPRLNAITDRTGAKIVVSSTWRLNRTVERLAEILRLHGATGEVVGKTPSIIVPNGRLCADGSPSLKRAERGIEIQRWIDDWNEACKFGPGIPICDDEFVILDDNSDMAHLKHRLVQTSWETGLLDHHVEMACQMLGVHDE